jgi:glycosyltransferase involved in cell wall biosynthesis
LSADRDRLLILIPAFNEARALPAVLEKIRTCSPEDILVVDDGSSDGTPEIARAHGARAVSHPFNLGYGVALQTGYRYALENGYAVVVQLDADGQHEPSEIPKLAGLLREKGLDLAIGSRFLSTESYRPPLARRAGMALFRTAVRLLTGLRLTDSTSGYKALGREVLRFLAGERFPVDFPDADVLIMLHRAGFRIGEAPVRMYENPRASSMHSGLKPVYYVFKMLLSILVTLLREVEVARGEPLPPAKSERVSPSLLDAECRSDKKSSP